MSKHIRIPCPECRRTLRVHAAHVEHQVRCKFCYYVFLIPRYLELTCPSCQRSGRVRTLHVGRSIKCKHCQTPLRIQTGSGAESGESPLQSLGISKEQLTLESSDLIDVEALLGQGDHWCAPTDPRSPASEPVAPSAPPLDAGNGHRRLEQEVAELRRALEAAQGAAAREEGLRAELETARAEQQQLRLQLTRLEVELVERNWVEAQRQAAVNEANALRARLNDASEELMSLRAERDRLDAEYRAAASEASSLFAHLADDQWPAGEPLGPRGASLSELAAIHNRGDLRALIEPAPETDAEIDALRQRLHDAEAKLQEEQDRAVAERRQWNEQLDALKQQFDEGCQVFQDVIEHLQQAGQGASSALEARLKDAERNLVEAEARAEAERREWNVQLDTLGHRFEEGCALLEAEIERLLSEHEQLSAQRDSAERDAQALAQDHARLASQRETVDSAHQIEVRRQQGELKQLLQALDQMRAHAAAVETQHQEVRRLLAQALAQQEQERAKHQTTIGDYERGLGALQQELQAVHSEFEAERKRLQTAAESGRSDLLAQLADSRLRLDEATTRAVQLETELTLANDQIRALCQDVGLHYGTGPKAAGPQAESVITFTAQKRIDDLAHQLHQARRETAHLRSILDYLGVESRM